MSTFMHRLTKSDSLITKILFRLFYLLWLPLFAVLFSVSVYKYYNHKLFVIFLSVILWLIALCLIMVFRDLINSLSDHTVYILLSSISILMFIILFLAGRAMWVQPLNDTGTAYYAVGEILRDGSISKEINEYTMTYWSTNTSNHDYFLIYPNTTFLVFYQLCYYRILRVFSPIDLYDTSGYTAAIVLNAVSITLAVIFGFLTAKKAKDNCTAFFFLILSFFFVPYYLHVFKVYSDTLSLPYVTAPLYFYVKGAQTDSGKKTLIYNILAGLLLSLGILVKGSIAILLIAVVIYTLLRPDTLKRTLSTLFCLILVCFAILNIWSLYRDNCSWLDTSEADKYEFPSIHWVMMAAKGGSGYKTADVEYSLSFSTYAERKQADTEEFIRRVKSYNSAHDYIVYQIKKVSNVMANGLYAQSEHLETTFEAAPALADWVSWQGKHYSKFYCYITIYITFFYISMLISAVLGIFRKKHSLTTLFNICFFGLMLFFSFWEFKSRYLLNFVPLFMLCSSFTISECAEIFKSFRKKHSLKTEN